ncbi:MAG TPA: PEP-CTERM sorting domain-containing protein [Sphingomonadales bacterium]
MINFRLVGMALAALLGACFAAGPATAAPSHAVFAFSITGTPELHLTTDGGEVIVQATHTGWYREDGYHQNINPNYLTGFCSSSDACRGDDRNYRSFFAFDLANVSGSILSASLSIGNPAQGLHTTEPSLLLNIHEVLTAFDDLVATHTDATDIFEDLGDGTLFGSYTVTAADNGTQVVVGLNDAAITALNAAIGSIMIFGGAVGSAVPTDVPAPASLALLALGVIGLRMINRRRMA